MDLQKQPRTIAYRPDVDGLRAIAVFVAVIFHYFPEFIPGGFVGVDIFFVISGFLISKIILSELADQSFSFLHFYQRRALRLFPALIFLFIFCLAFGGFILMSSEFKELAKYIVASVLFSANILLKSESGYFDGATQEKPLMHLWSLGVEEQFYFLWPLLLFFAWRKRVSYSLLIVGIILSSFALKLTLEKNLNSHFFLPHYRLWELALGGLLAWIHLVREKKLSPVAKSLDAWLARHLQKDLTPKTVLLWSNLSSCLGAVLFLWAFYYFQSDFIFPGYWVLAPTIATFLIIAAGPGAWINQRILANKFLVGIGLLSFPIYLWHWPLYSFAQIASSGPPSWPLKISGLLFTLIAALISYHLIENPLRFGHQKNRKAILVTVILMGIGVSGLITYYQGGFTHRQQEADEFLSYFENSLPHRKYSAKIDQARLWRSECSFYDRNEIDPSCYRRNKKKKAVFIWGDSHGQAISPGIRKHIPEGWEVLQIATATCSPQVAIQKKFQSKICQKSNQVALDKLRAASPEVVVLAQLHEGALDYFSSVSSYLFEIGVKKIIVVGPPPHWKAPLSQILARSLWLQRPQRTYEGLKKGALEHNQWFKTTFPFNEKLVFADIIGTLCNSEGCLTHIGGDIRTGITALDELHLSPIAADYVAKNLLMPLITKGYEAK